MGSTRPKLYKPFQVFQHLIDHELFLPTVRSAWEEVQVQGNPWYCLTTKLKHVKHCLKQLNQAHGNLHDKVRLAQDELASWQSNMRPIPSDADLREEKRLGMMMRQ